MHPLAASSFNFQFNDAPPMPSFSGSGGTGFPFLFILIIVAAVGLAIYGFYAAAKRRKELQEWAARKGLSFTAGNDYSFDERFASFQALRQGSRRYAYNIMTGSLFNRPCTCFDYHFETYSTDNKGNRQTHHHYFSAAVLQSDVPLRPLFIRPEGFFDKITEFFGYDDIDFESAEFSRKFYVTSPDKKWAYDVLHQRTMEFMLAMPKFTLQFDGSRVYICRGSTFNAAEFEAAAELVDGILSRFPEYLVKQQREGMS
ncbi:MAG: hypothetical protein GC162_11110 [Planctomycetes bacterium]|nr:hypothetical protein [Planctomycetota bacterium]